METQLNYLGKKLRRQKQINENLKDENLVLRQLAGIPEPAIKQVNREGKNELKAYSEKFLYDQVVNSYKSKDLTQMERSVKVFLEEYPHSKKLDNAVYLHGLLNYKVGRFAESLTIFDQVLEKYPKGNKVPAAYLGKALAYKSLNLADQSKFFFDTVIQKYPNSPESIRAKREVSAVDTP